jgi:predicted amino acid dehydrogenase
MPPLALVHRAWTAASLLATTAGMGGAAFTIATTVARKAKKAKPKIFMILREANATMRRR